MILDRTKLGEQDLILTLLAADGSEVRAVAKGARRPGGRLAARTDLFSEVDLLLAAGRSLDVVCEAALVNAHAGIRGELDRVCAASAICEVARLTCIDGTEDPFLYPMLCRALAACEEAADRPHLDLAAAAYAFKALAHGGWRPELDRCVSCGDGAPTFFSVAAGGVLCESCAREVEGAEPVSPSRIGWLRFLISATFDQLLDAEIDPETARGLMGEAHVWASTHLDARLRAFEFALST